VFEMRGSRTNSLVGLAVCGGGWGFGSLREAVVVGGFFFKGGRLLRGYQRWHLEI
jgi:hypothetical protein